MSLLDGGHSSLLTGLCLHMGALSYGLALVITNMHICILTQPEGLQEDLDTGMKASSHPRHFAAFKIQALIQD